MLEASIQTEGTVTAVEESIAEIAGIRGDRRVRPEELELAVAALTRGYARNFETADQVARAVTQIALYDLPDSYFTDFIPRMASITVDDVTRVAAAHLDPARLTTLVVGDPAAMRDDFARLNLGETAVLADEAF
jgi:predicted Zn-dependent peptidase